MSGKSLLKSAAVRWCRPLLAASLLFAPVAGNAQAAGDSAIAQGGKGEIFFAAIPEGWHALPRNPENSVHMQVAEWMPAGQKIESWTDMITLQVFPRFAGVDPVSFLDRLAGSYQQNCEKSGATPPLTDEVNGFPTAFRLINCTRDLTRQTGEVALFRATTGRQALYLFQRVFRVPEFEVGGKPVSDEAMKTAFEVIRVGWACQKGSQKQVCPESWKPVFDKLNQQPSVVVIKGK